jgi:nicotinamidase-related amidase
MYMTTALIIIDVQNAILTGLGTPERQPVIDAALDGVVARLAEVKARARTAGAPVILVQHDGPDGHRLRVGSDGWRLRAEIAPGASDIVVHKTACDSFYATDLEARLKALGATHLVVGGCMSQYCVDTTVRRAVSLGYDVTLLSDGHMTADMGSLTFDQITAHHNAVLDGFDAGAHLVRLQASNGIAF